jgi:cytochrome b subunit of formate dehydrogenase
METKSKELTNKIESPKVLKSFGILMGSVFSIVSIVLFLKGSKWWVCGFGSIALIFFGLAFFAPLFLNTFHRKWMRFAEVLGAFNMKLILGFVYMTCFSFLGLIFKIIGKDPMKRRFEPKAESYWIDHEVVDSGYGLERYERQY